MVLLPYFLRRRSRLKPPPSLAVELPLGERKRSGVHAAARGRARGVGHAPPCCRRAAAASVRNRAPPPPLGVDWDLGVKRLSGRESPWVNGRVLELVSFGPDGYALLGRPNTAISS